MEVPTVEEMDCGRCSIRSWQEFQAELKAQFMPGNVSWMARQALFNLKPVRCEMNVHQVVIDAGYKRKDMSEEDKLFFMKGLHFSF